MFLLKIVIKSQIYLGIEQDPEKGLYRGSVNAFRRLAAVIKAIVADNLGNSNTIILNKVNFCPYFGPLDARRIAAIPGRLFRRASTIGRGFSLHY
jgi:hypothetical protein